MPTCQVIQPGLFTTVQDLGRPGFTSMGVPRSGAADTLSLRAGNRLVGNADSEAALEMTLTGGSFSFDEETVVALTGAAAAASITDAAGAPRLAAIWRPLRLRACERLDIGPLEAGARAYLCVQGGIDVTVSLGSRSSLESGGIGLFAGRRLRSGDTLRVGVHSSRAAAPINESITSFVQMAIARRVIHVTRGPRGEQLAPGAFDALTGGAFTVSEHSDRSGARLEGPAMSGLTRGRMITEPMPIGAVQLPERGGPIVLLPDGPTTGGYPIIACVALADLPAVGQLRPRDAVRFVEASLDEARAASREQERILSGERTIDLNCDLGESPEELSRDLALLGHVSSVNIACGGHAGDEATQRAIVRAARARGVSIGAHPGYPDRVNFGRIEMGMKISDLKFQMTEQIGTLARVARSEGAAVHHLKPHGALYHAAMARAEIAEAIAEAARGLEPAPVLVGLRGSKALEAWRAMGFRVLEESFADRRYEPDGSLRARSKPGAVIESSADAAAQAVRLAGRADEWAACTICVHSDTPGSLAIAEAVRRGLEHAGFTVGARIP